MTAATQLLLRTALKATTAAGVAFAGAVATGYTDSAMTAGEWWAAAAVGLAAFGAVYGVENRPPTEL